MIDDLDGTEEGFRALLALQLQSIEINNGNYPLRQQLIFHALSTAIRAGFQAGIRIDPSEPQWLVAFIELPQGQVSWHLQQHLTPWDGHDTAEKYARCRRFILTQVKESASAEAR